MLTFQITRYLLGEMFTTMRMRFINKHIANMKPQKSNIVTKVASKEAFSKEIVEEKVNNEDKKEDTVMNTDKIGMAEAVLDETPKAVKKIKKDKGLIERAESSKTIITEDNKQVLFG